LEKANEKGVVIADKVLIFYEDGWHHLISVEMMRKLRNEDYEEYKDITGKYLFFSPDLPTLTKIGSREIIEHNFHVAKINSRLSGSNTEYVLCLYCKDDSRKHELANRCKTDCPGVKYRYWKSDESTRKGQYSQEFLSRLDPETRKRFGKSEGV
jgi:hypothetical protein